MQEWLPQLVTAILTALTTGGGLAVWFNYRMSRLNAIHRQDLARTRQTRLDRADEIDVLHKDIEDLRTDRDDLKKELAEVRREFAAAGEKANQVVSDLKDKLTASLIEQGRLREREQHLEKRVHDLEAELAKLRGEQ